MLCRGWVLLSLLAFACDSAGEGDDASGGKNSVAELRSALPAAESTSILMPGNAASAPNRALFYNFTRGVTLSINEVLRRVSATIEDIVDREPTQTDGETYAVWGPWTDALAPVTYRARVERSGDTFEYVVHGWAKGADEGTAVEVLRGTSTPREGAGAWTYDMSANYALDPVATLGRGRITVAFSVGATRTLEVTLDAVEWAGEPTPTSTLYRYAATPDGAGSFDFVSNLDIHEDDEPELDRRELVQVRSRWLADGPGRADVYASQGDLPDDVEVQVVQCWDASFAQTHVSFVTPQGTATEGDADRCPFPVAERPEFADFDPGDFADEDLIAALPQASDFALGLARPGALVPEAEQADYYKLTVGVLFSMQVQVTGVLATLRNITRQRPTDCDERGCQWGPWTDWNTRATWRVDVQRQGQGEFTYRLEAKFFGEPASAWRAVVTGGFVESDGDDGQGWFEFDNEHLAEVDPDHEGTANVRAEYARLGIGAALAMRVGDGDDEQSRYAVSVVNGAGTLDARFEADLDGNRPGRAAIETVEARVRWLADGAGVGNLVAWAGNIGDRSLAAVECWDTTAKRTHFDIVNRAPGDDRTPNGDGPGCVFSDWQTPEFRALGDE